MKRLLFLPALFLLFAHPGMAQETESKPPPRVNFEEGVYVLGNIGGNESEFFNEYFPEGGPPREASQFLVVRHYPGLENAAEFIAGFSQRLSARHEGLKVNLITTPDPNTEGVSYQLATPDGRQEFSLFIAIKVPTLSGLYAKHLVVRSKDEAEVFRALTQEKQSAWMDALMAVSFPAVIPPENLRGGGSVDPSKLPELETREETVGDFSFAGIEIKGLLIGSSIVVDEAFTTKWENKPPSAPFKVIVPKQESILTLAGGKKEGVPELLRVTFADEAKTTALEILRFSNLTIPLQENPENRLKLCAHTIDSQVLPMVFRGKKDAKVTEFYTTKMGGNEAVVFHGQNTDPQTGELYFVKVAGILHPSKPGGVLAFLSAHGTKSPITSGEDLRSEGVGLRIMHSVRFLDE